VHALRHAHELLVSGGILVDLHPVTEERVEANRQTIGVIEEPDWVAVVLPNAEARLREAIHDGYYTLEAEIEFDLFQHFDSIDELIEAKSDRLEVQPDLVQRIRQASPPLITSEHYIGRRLRAR
jgi:hypothetical protein